MAFKKDTKIKSNFTKITISLASPEEILENSFGEVTKPETINYRTYKPERDGLFCERIFGPTKDFECACGKYKRIRYKGIVCDRCGVEVTEKKVRRERTGHIELVVPVAHIWYFRSLPNKIGYLLGLPTKKLDSVVYYEKYIVVQPGVLAGRMDPEKEEELNGSHKMDLLTEDEYLDLMDQIPEDNEYLDDSDPNKFIAKMGAEAIYDLLAGLDLDSLSYELRDRANTDSSQQRKTEALKRLQVVEAFRGSSNVNRPEWMIMKIIPVTPPELRPLVPLDGGRFATSDLNDLYRRVIIRNNRLKRLIEIKAPEVILRNEKRMLQEAVDSLFDNSRKSSAVKSESNRPLKSLSDSLKGKAGRFRQNLLGKRVDYSARSVIVVGPELKMGECGLPKLMAAELYKPFIIRKLIERGIVKTVKSAKKIVDRREPVIWDILENVMKGHPVLLNRAPTLHRLGIQAFQPKLIEGKAIQLHPLACTAFNADFDGDQMAVHLPLSNEAVLEAQILMLQSHNILNPANGAPITVPSQDMVLGLYYITKIRPGAKGEGLTFYGPEEAIIAHNEGRCDLHAQVKVVVKDLADNGGYEQKLVETSVGRVIVNGIIPDEVGYVNKVISKKSLRDIISDVIKAVGFARACEFLDGIKNLGYRMAYLAGLSFNLDDIIIPEEKKALVERGNDEVRQITDNYNMGFITDKERYNQVIDAWTHVNNELGDVLMKQMTEADQGFNAVYMMLDSGARGSKDQIRQLAGMRGLMAKPQKAGAEGAQIIENPILSNFKEGMSVLEYFISTHGARKGLADTAMKTADAGYLTRRLVDVSHDVIINEEDCGTLRGLVCTALKNGDEVISTLYERILGRVSVHDIVNPQTGELIVAAGDEITESIAQAIEDSPIESVEIRSVLTCESKHGVCMKCYGRNLATSRMVQKGEAVGVIAAQAIGEPGTQLTLRTFHAGGVAANAAANATIVAKNDSKIEFDELRTVPFVEKTDDGSDRECEMVVSRLAEIRFIDPHTGITLSSMNVPYGSSLYHKAGDVLAKGEVIAKWDPFNAVIVTEYAGTLKFRDVIEGVTYHSETDDTTGLTETIITESKDKSKVPTCDIIDENGEVIGTYNLPVGGHVVVVDGQKVATGVTLVKIPRSVGKAGDITGGLPRVTELFEARNPSNPAVVSEIDGEVTMGKVKRGNREIIVTSKTGEQRKYLVSLSKQILVQEHDAVRAGTPLSDGSITPGDILAIKGPTAVQEYIVNEVQDVYRLQGVKINDKHFEIIVRQMMRKVQINDPGDTTFLEQQMVDKLDFAEENDRIWGKKVVVDAGDSDTLQKGQIITARRLRDENSSLKRRDLKLVQVRDAVAATSTQILQGITRAALQTKSFMSAASFQETTKVLNEAAIRGKVDRLEGMKENVICGHLIPAGTGLREFEKIIVGSQEEHDRMQANRKNVIDYSDKQTIEEN
ncbi:MAG: DNA-directed RNA polymerase subunit beta' [Prevotella pectinovora]|jgi:DNA-directed RNA polymerase subunit beta'|uniref:DNA-directed RNA polymerase subunit beta' n=4 Tax=Prevotella TaxID=838 RepID=A0A0D0IT85_9BACT|nr:MULTISPECIES: DNA-directed RNA polymerase subunit beta' [Prevotella]KIP57220.1 DNA-directed RNA polymerase subunit beta' [Prevotella pectinovora]KIP60164.1 DNA-directed RNA polymerase subunit beta' [Prevotella pectinovora]KIP61841.1 DNA-directed RNA polymerase subunit beta' [Prevotella pectinovora]MDY4778822.1 DNA-directed RNA polymerase subunit beta' [Prevotella pectinovora]MEE1547256.1 DNA-directed RNA polymerase subunit beta' [Prevotella pectinovora]